MNILVTLNSGLGADTGPNFNLTADVGSVTPSTATKVELLAGKFVDVDVSATQITVTSTGTCTTSIVLNIVGQTTTTTTSAASSFVLGYDLGNFFTACTDYSSSPTTYYSTTGAVLQVGTTLYNESSLTTKVVPGFYSNGTDWFQCNVNGVATATGSCSTTSTTTSTSTSTSTSTTTEAPTTSTTSTTTTLGPETFSLGYDASVGWQSCYASQTNYYANALDTLVNGLNLYTDITLDTPAPSGYYSNGANYWFIPPVCIEYTFTNNTGFDNYVDYIDCNGASQQIYVYDGTTSTAVCVDTILDLRSMTANNNGAGSCPPSTTGVFQDETPCPTTTTTSTTSTTSTSTSTSTTSTSTSTSTTTSTSSTTSTTTAAPTSTTTSTSSTTSTTTEAPTTTTTTAASTTTTTEPPTTTTTSTSTSTSTSTTTLPGAVNFDIANVCNAGYGDITINNFVGGGGTYQASTVVYSSQALALAGTFSDVATSRTYNTNSDGLYWVAVRDKASTGNVLARSIVVSCATTTTTSTSTSTSTSTTTQAPCSLVIYVDSSASPSPGGWDTQAGACAGTGTPLTVYFSNIGGCETTFSGVFNNGKALYTNSSLTTLLQGNDKFFKDTSAPNSGNTIQIGNDGFIDSIGDCTTTTTTSTSTTTTTTTAAPQCTYDGLTIVCDSTTTTTTTEPPTTTTTTAASATLQWDFTETGGANGSMDLFVNGSVIESRVNTSNGTYTVYVGDTINVQVTCDTCGSPNDYSNAYSISNKPILSDADCAQSGLASIFTSVYTVVSGDVGTNINLSTFASCDYACV